jgi:GntR family transcriptional repressor for pyruvate dehydrogenase complex
MAIECDAAYYAAMRRQPKHLATLSAAIAEMDAALRIKSLDHDAHFRFHLAIAEAATNQYFVDALLSLRQYLEVSMNLFRELWLINPGEQVYPGTHSHSRIFRAIENAEPGKAYRAMFLHIDEARRELFGNLGDPWPGHRDSEE